MYFGCEGGGIFYGSVNHLPSMEQWIQLSVAMKVKEYNHMVFLQVQLLSLLALTDISCRQNGHIASNEKKNNEGF